MSKNNEGIIDLDDQIFSEYISKNRMVLVDFWAPWCGPCVMQTPILEKVAEQVGDKAVIAKMNVDENQQVAAKYGIRSIPTIMIFKNGELAEQFVGVQQEQSLVDALAV